MTMITNREDRIPATSRSVARPREETPYDLVVVCLWAVFAVALTALVIWLALGGAF
jgi:hypothetical protein